MSAIACALLGLVTASASATTLVAPVFQAGKPSSTQLVGIDTDSPAFGTIAAPNANFSSFETPSWAADGEQLTYVSVGKQVATTGGTDVRRLREIWIQSADGSERRRVTRDSFDYLPVFSDDAKRIAFARYFPGHSGRGCVRGGYAVAVVSTVTTNVKRVSRCFTNLLMRSTLQFVDAGKRVAFVGDRRHVASVSVSGADAALARPKTMYKQPKNEAVVSIRGSIPKANSIWVDFEDGSSVLTTSRGRATILPDATFAVAPTGKTAIVNCGAVPAEGICAIDVKSRAKTKLKSPFTPDFTQDSAEFGFSFSSDGRSLASFGYATHDALSGLSDLQICIRAALTDAPTCRAFSLGTIVERDSDIALWQPRPSGA